MGRRDESLGRLPAPGNTPTQRLSGEVVPCPRCGLLAPVLSPPPDWTFPEARCTRGHLTVLVPAVHAHLRSRLGAAFS